MPPLESITTMTLHPAQVSWTRRINQTAPEPPVSTKNLCIYSSVQGQAVRAENCHHHTWAHTTSQSCGYAAPPLLRTAPWVESFLPLGQWKIPLKKKKKAKSLPPCFFLRVPESPAEFHKFRWLLASLRKPESKFLVAERSFDTSHWGFFIASNNLCFCFCFAFSL